MGNLSEQTSIQFALTLDYIWSLRNKVINNNFKFNIHAIIKDLELRIQEHIQALEDPAANSVEKEKKCHIWEASALEPLSSMWMWQPTQILLLLLLKPGIIKVLS